MTTYWLQGEKEDEFGAGSDEMVVLSSQHEIPVICSSDLSDNSLSITQESGTDLFQPQHASQELCNTTDIQLEAVTNESTINSKNKSPIVDTPFNDTKTVNCTVKPSSPPHDIIPHNEIIGSPPLTHHTAEDRHTTIGLKNSVIW